jgi:hypothetical protein
MPAERGKVPKGVNQHSSINIDNVAIQARVVLV